MKDPEKTNIICILCPRGCMINISGDKFEGAGCSRGEAYAKEESMDPRRTVTSTVGTSGMPRLVPVKTNRAVSKNLVFPIMDIINKFELDAASPAGTVLIKNIAGSGADLVTTDNYL